MGKILHYFIQMRLLENIVDNYYENNFKTKNYGQFSYFECKLAYVCVEEMNKGGGA